MTSKPIEHKYKYKTATSIIGLGNQPIQKKIKELLNISYQYDNLTIALYEAGEIPTNKETK